MREVLLSFARSRRQFIVYCLIGVTGVSLDYASFFVLVNWFGIHYLVANVISTSLGIINNFILNCMFNFKIHNRLLLRFLSFYCVGLAGLAVSSLLLFVAVSSLHFNPNVAKAFTLVLIVLLQYNLNRLVSFK